MDQDSLVIEQIDEGAIFLAEFARKYPVRVAYWMKPTEDAQWYLYVVSDQINDKNIKEAYREVRRVDQQRMSPCFDRFRINLLSADDANATATLDIRSRYPGRLPIRFNGKSFGGLPVEGVYIYPPLAEIHAS